MARAGRARGYHYIRLANGRKKRVYNTGRQGGRRQGGYRKKSYVGKSRRTIYSGYGAYRLQRSMPIAHRVGRGRVRGGTRPNNQVPIIKNSKGGSVIIQHTEYLGDVESSAAFSNNSYFLNPGISLSNGGFTEWLWNVAGNFEEWKARGICFHYKSTSAEYSSATGSALGTVSMATNYNTYNNAFTTKIAMENYEGSNSTKPSKNQNMFVEVENKQTPVHPLYVRTTAALPAGADQRLYDLGVFQLATSGMNSSGATVGELWVSYEIEFFKPRLNPDPQAIYDHFQIAPAAGVLPATPFGTSQTGLLFPTTSSSAGGAISGGIVPAASCVASPTTASRDNFEGGVPTNNGTGQALGPTTANTYYFPPTAPIGSIWMLSYGGFGWATGTANTWSTLTAYQGVAANLLGGDTLALLTNVGTASSTLNLVLFVKITGANANIVMVNSGGQLNNAGAQQADFFAVQLGTGVDQLPNPFIGPPGPAGPTGPTGPTGPAGPGYSSQTTVISSTTLKNASPPFIELVTAIPGYTIIPVLLVYTMTYGGTNPFTNGVTATLYWNGGGFIVPDPQLNITWMNGLTASKSCCEGALSTTISQSLNNGAYTNINIAMQLNAAMTGNAANDNSLTITVYYFTVPGF